MQQDTHQWTRKRTNDAVIQLNAGEPSLPLALATREPWQQGSPGNKGGLATREPWQYGSPGNKGGLPVQIYQELHDSLVTLHGPLLDSAHHILGEVEDHGALQQGIPHCYAPG